MGVVLSMVAPAYLAAPPSDGQRPAPVGTDIQLDWRVVPPSDWIKVTASWYGPGFHGSPRADGLGDYDMYDFSAAHVSLPFGTVLRLYSEKEYAWVDVVINDSGPYNPLFLPPYRQNARLRPHPSRQLDLSWAAADALGIIGKGVGELWVVGTPGESGPLVLDDLYADLVVRGSLRQQGTRQRPFLRR